MDFLFQKSQNLFNDLLEKHQVRYSSQSALETERLRSAGEIYLLLKKGWSEQKIVETFELVVVPTYPKLKNLN